MGSQRNAARIAMALGIVISEAVKLLFQRQWTFAEYRDGHMKTIVGPRFRLARNAAVL